MKSSDIGHCIILLTLRWLVYHFCHSTDLLSFSMHRFSTTSLSCFFFSPRIYLAHPFYLSFQLYQHGDLCPSLTSFPRPFLSRIRRFLPRTHFHNQLHCLVHVSPHLRLYTFVVVLMDLPWRRLLCSIFQLNLESASRGEVDVNNNVAAISGNDDDYDEVVAGVCGVGSGNHS